MKDFNNKKIYVILTISVIVAGTILGYIVKTIKTNDEEISEEITEVAEEETNFMEEESENEDNILIHVSGCVKSPGIVILSKESRIIDAIKAAGGETEDANLDKLNLAFVLEDGQKLYIPSKYEKTENEEETEEEYISSDSGKDVITEGANNAKGEKEEVININTAMIDKLITLPGIGESTANKIIAYRKANGKFKTVEDIKNVPGIGDVKFENFKSKITV